MEKGEGHKYRGMSLDDTNISVEDVISDEEEEDIENEDESSENTSYISHNQSIGKIKCKNITIIPWSEKEKILVKNYFKNHIHLKKAPKKPECEDFIQKHNVNKPWKKIKDYVHNAATTYKKKNNL